ncbi:MAG: HEAT repeat domain-containing protein [Gemmatimonadales bacterium]|nr:HEAT repeat domain-containing protein [Gemmatimonadales bacterium]
MSAPHAAPVPVAPVNDLLQTLVKALRAFKMYLPNNPIYAKAAQNVQAAFAPVWQHTDELTLRVMEGELRVEDEVVYAQPNRSESFAWALYKDGLRLLVLRRGVEAAEIVRFLEVVNRARFLPADAGDDLLTLLWEQEFTLIQYRFADPDGQGDPSLGGAGTGTAFALAKGANEAEPSGTRAAGVRAEAGEAARPKGVVDPEEFDSTLYFLDDSEVTFIAGELQVEYARDVRQSALDALFDIFEVQADGGVREEVVAVVESLLPNLLAQRDFRAVAGILRELRTLAGRAASITSEQQARLASFEARLSEPDNLAQLVQSLDEMGVTAGDDDVAELLRELRPGAIGTLVAWMPKLARPEVQALLRASLDRLAALHPQEVVALLKDPATDGLGALVALAGRLRLQAAVPGLAESAAHADPAIRLGAVEALAEIATPGALQAIERAIDDADRGVRLAAVRACGTKGHRQALRRLEPVVQGKVADRDLTERMAIFEAYGALAGAAGIEPLAAILLPRGLFGAKAPAEQRACAAIALGRIGTAEAKGVLQKAADDKEPVVRNAVLRALRGGRA